MCAMATVAISEQYRPRQVSDLGIFENDGWRLKVTGIAYRGAAPRKELVDRLLDYQRFKAVAESFAELDVLRMGMWSRPRVPLPGDEPQVKPQHGTGASYSHGI